MARREVVMSAAAAGLVSGCASTSSSRFKLSLAVQTPDGVKAGYSVCEILLKSVNLPERGIVTKLVGEAVFVDCGAGRRPLIALLTRMDGDRFFKKPTRTYWSGDGGPMTDFFLELYGDKADPGDDFIAQGQRLNRHRGTRTMPPVALPDLVTFADTNVAASVLPVDWQNLSATLGPGVSWHSITLEMTDEPVTKGIVRRLPWLAKLPGSLSGQLIRYANGPFANQLGQHNFIMER